MKIDINNALITTLGIFNYYKMIYRIMGKRQQKKVNINQRKEISSYKTSPLRD